MPRLPRSRPIYGAAVRRCCPCCNPAASPAAWNLEMTPNESHEASESQTLERLLDRALRELPLRRAPLTLESRVFGELQRRAALPWWRRSFAHWPLLARAAFLVICGVLIRLAFLGGATAVAGVRSLSWAREA